MASAAKNSTPWTGRSRSTPDSRDRPGIKKRPAQYLPHPCLGDPSFLAVSDVTRDTALCSSEGSCSSFRGSRLTPERSSKSSDLGARIHSVPRSSRRQGAQLESSSSSASSASAAVTLARVAQRPRFLNRSTNSAMVQQRDCQYCTILECLLKLFVSQLVNSARFVLYLTPSIGVRVPPPHDATFSRDDFIELLVTKRREQPTGNDFGATIHQRTI